MKKWSVILLLLVILTGCRSTPFDSYAQIDWVDFIKWGGKNYEGIYTGVLSDKKFIGKKIGTVKFKVADNITNPNYKIRDGDAAFHEKGTEIFAIKGYPNFIAVKSSRAINGYQIYFSEEDIKYKWHFKDMPIDKVSRIEIYQANTPDGTKKIKDLNNIVDVKRLLQLLNNSKVNSNFQPNMQNGDPIFYEMIFYTDDLIAYKYDLQFDGQTYFWHPWDTSVLTNEIGDFLPQN